MRGGGAPGTLRGSGSRRSLPTRPMEAPVSQLPRQKPDDRRTTARLGEEEPPPTLAVRRAEDDDPPVRTLALGEDVPGPVDRHAAPAGAFGAF